MRILIVSPHFPPWNSVAALRVHAFARAWADAGEKVSVLTSVKPPDQAVRPMDVSGLDVHEVAYSVPGVLRRVRESSRDSGPAGAPSRRKSLLARLRERTGVFSSVRMPDLTDWWVGPALARGKSLGAYDVVFSSAGPYTAHLVARGLRRARVAPRWAAEFRDLWTDNHIYTGLFPFTLRERSLDRAVRREADLLVTVSEPLAGRLRAAGARNVLVACNGFVAGEFGALDAAPAFADDGLKRVVYTGKLYHRGQDPRPLLRALRLLNDPHLRLTVAGPDSLAWRALGAETGAGDWLEIVGEVERRTALRMQRDADALAIFEWIDPHAGVLTGKVFEYLASGPPILVVGGPSDGSIAELVVSTGRGEAIGSDPEPIAARLASVLRSPRAAARGAERDPRVAVYERSAQARKVLDAMRGLASCGA
jgi:glycosyltransferase involved in cell wall biosynthesis